MVNNNNNKTPANAGDHESQVLSGLGRCPGGGHGHPLQYSCLETPMDTGAWLLRLHRVAKSQTQLKHHSTCGHNFLLEDNFRIYEEYTNIFKYIYIYNF